MKKKPKFVCKEDKQIYDELTEKFFDTGHLTDHETTQLASIIQCSENMEELGKRYRQKWHAVWCVKRT